MQVSNSLGNHGRFLTQRSKDLIDGVARVSGGFPEFIEQEELINEIVMRQLARAAVPYFRNVSLQWSGTDAEIPSPTRIPFLFLNQKNIMYSILIAPEKFEGRLCLCMTGCDSKEIKIEIPVTYRDAMDIVHPGSIMALAARDVIEYMEHEEMRIPKEDASQRANIRQAMVNLSLQV